MVGVVLTAAASQADLKGMLEDLIAKADLNPKQRDAALWVLDSLAPPLSPESDTATVAPNGGGVPSQVS